MSNEVEGTKNEATPELQTLVIERSFRHSPEKLWRALTESTVLAQWLMNNDFAPEAGRPFQFRADPVPQWDGIIQCKVLVVEPLKQLSYTWGSMGLETVVLWTLTQEESGTHLRMEQSGFPSSFPQAYGGAKYGWQRFLGKLEQVLDGSAA